MRNEHSRALRLAAGSSSLPASVLETCLDNATVVISVDPDMPQAELLARVLVTTLRRGPGHIVLLTSGLPHQLIEVLETASYAIDPHRPLRLARVAPDGVRVHLGTNIAGRAIRLVPEGCGTHLATDRTVTIRPVQPGNPLGAIYGAALGAAEVFKHTAQVIGGRRIDHRHLRFCPVTLSTDLQRSPSLNTPLRLDLALIGVGAIGTAIVLILSELDAEGILLAVDRQRFALENRGTYSLGGDADACSEPWKVDLATQALSRFDVTPFHNDVEALIREVDAGRKPWFPTVLTALDSPEARRAAQRLWPDRLIDAATGDTMLGLHDHRHSIDPCMICHFPIRTDQPSGAQAVADHFGLPAELLADGNVILRKDHIDHLPQQKRDRAAPHIGARMCALARAAGLTYLDADDFMPSIPFVSMQAACLAVGRLLAAELALPTQGNLVQYDSLIGPQAATIETMRVRPACQCGARAAVIEHVRSRRRGTTTLSDRQKYR